MASRGDVAVETPTPGVGVALLGGMAIFARRRR
jgi:MYXO-CTERM domain-containing protein